MNNATKSRLQTINQEFYQTFALQFSQTRQRIQPGVRKILEQVKMDATILDLGCGNGQILNALIQIGYQGFYVGVDSSPALLQIASQVQSPRLVQQPQLFKVDLSSPDWDSLLLHDLNELREIPGITNFDLVLAFAIMHHLPGSQNRSQFVKKIRQFLRPNALFIHSNWQFLNNPKLRNRILEWSTIGLAISDVDPNDYLLDWRQGGRGIRYVHHFSQEELTELAQENDYEVLETFHSDGVNGELGLYQVWALKHDKSQ